MEEMEEVKIGDNGTLHKIDGDIPRDAKWPDDFWTHIYTVKFKRGKNGNILTEAYTPEGYYIGDLETAQLIIEKMGIKPEPPKKVGNACILGFCEKEQMWYGWSHRAYFGFGIGTMYKPGDSGYKEYVKLGLSNPAKTLEDAKQMAICFAEDIQ